MSQIIETEVAVLGAGVSGLATAYWLYKEGIDVKVFEKNAEPGGSMESVRQDGFMFDRGPNSGLETTPLLEQLVKELNLQDEFVYSNPEGNKRYILKNDRLHPLPMNPAAFLQTKLFSGNAKLRVMKEPFIGKSDDGYYQSLADFVRRRLGDEFLDYAINPFVSGVYAGDPENLSVKSAFPKLYELEEKYGSLILGTIRTIKERRQRAEKSKQSAKMFSFVNGMQTLPKALAYKLGERVYCLNDVLSVKKTGDFYEISCNRAGDFISTIKAKCVINTMPAHVSGRIMSEIAPDSVNHFDGIFHPPVMVLYVGFEKEKIARKLDGFGYLIPEKENKSYLGAIWTSTIFPARAPKDSESFTIFIGGARNVKMFEKSRDEIIKQAIKEFSELMNITGEPNFIAHRLWSKAIPQYDLGYIEHERYFDELEKRLPGIFISGNYRGGISVGDCIKNSKPTAEKVIEFLRK